MLRHFSIVASFLLLPWLALAQNTNVAVSTPPPATNPWGADQRIVIAPAVPHFGLNTAASFASDGSNRLHLVWIDHRQGTENVVYRQGLGGALWGSEMILSATNRNPENACVAVSGSKVFVAWQENFEGKPVIKLKISPNDGAQWGQDITIGPGMRPILASWGSTVHLANEAPHGELSEIVYRRSEDHGVTWSPELMLSEPGALSWMPTMALGQTTVFVAWVDLKDNNEELYLKRSGDLGKTWGPAQRLTQNDRNTGPASLWISGDQVHIAWADQKDAPAHPLEAEKKLDEALKLLSVSFDPTPGAVMVPMPHEAARHRVEEKFKQVTQNSNAWITAGGDAPSLRKILSEFEALLHREASLPEAEKKLGEILTLVGATNLPPVALPVPNEVETVESVRKRIEEKLKVLRNATPEFIRKDGDVSKLNGKLDEFSRLMSLSTPSTHQEREKKIEEAVALMKLEFKPTPDESLPKVYYLEAHQARVQEKIEKIQTTGPLWSQKGGDLKPIHALLAEFEKMHKGALGDWEIYYRTSLDSGQSWQPEVRISLGESTSTRPHLSGQGKNLQLVWSDLRDGNAEIYGSHSSDSGQSWAPESRLTKSPGESVFPFASFAGGKVHLVWIDNRKGNPEIFYKQRAHP